MDIADKSRIKILRINVSYLTKSNRDFLMKFYRRIEDINNADKWKIMYVIDRTEIDKRSINNTDSVTPYGEIIKEIAINESIFLVEIAKKLGYQKEFFRRIILGRRSVPVDFCNKIIETFKLNPDESKRLISSVNDYKPKYFHLNINNLDKEEVAMIVALSTKITNLDKNDRDMIYRILNS